MSEDKPAVRVETENGRTTIEVVDDDAATIVRGFLKTLETVVADAERIYVEVDEHVGVEDEAEPEAPRIDREEAAALVGETSEGSDSDPVSDAFDGLEISEGTAMHAVAWAIKQYGAMVVSEIDEHVDDYGKGTVSSSLTDGKNGHLFVKRPQEGGPSLWALTDWGHDQVTEVGEYGG